MTRRMVAAAANSTSAPRVLFGWIKCIAPWLVELFHLLRGWYLPLGENRSSLRTSGLMNLR